MAKVLYKQGTKQTYLGLQSRSSNALYFCTDTKELFKGDDLYSDGVRLVASYDLLPGFAVAADGILYFCEDSGCGYVLNTERDAWLKVIYGVDNETIEVSESGLMAVKAVPVAKVAGLEDELKRIEAIAVAGTDPAPIATADVAGVVKPGAEMAVAADGTLSLTAVAIEKVTGLEDRLAAIEQAAIGGVHYRGAVETIDALPADAKQGDLYEVRADNSEWCFNGEKWIEYGKTVEIDLSGYAEKDEVRDIAELVKFEISSKPEGTLVKYSEDEIRVMCPENTEWKHQAVGATGNSNMYYMGFKAYAPDGAVSFKESDNGVIEDEMFTFDDEFAGTDAYGRNYSIVWLPLASYSSETDSWSYYGKLSSADRYIGWDYAVEWYNADGVMIGSDAIRINLSNEACHNVSVPYYVSSLRKSIEAAEEAISWSNM